MKTDTVVRLKPSFTDVGYLITAKDNLHMPLPAYAPKIIFKQLRDREIQKIAVDLFLRVISIQAL